MARVRVRVRAAPGAAGVWFGWLSPPPTPQHHLLLRLLRLLLRLLRLLLRLLRLLLGLPGDGTRVLALAGRDGRAALRLGQA